jgi:hypothetical protein
LADPMAEMPRSACRQKKIDCYSRRYDAPRASTQRLARGSPKPNHTMPLAGVGGRAMLVGRCEVSSRHTIEPVLLEMDSET